MLHAHLYAKKHTNFNECCLDAMDYDDNFDISSISSHGDRKSEMRTSAKDVESTIPFVKDTQPDEIVELVLKRLDEGERHLDPCMPTDTCRTV